MVIGASTPIIGGEVSQPQLLQSVPWLYPNYHRMPYCTILFHNMESIYRPVEGYTIPKVTMLIHEKSRVSGDFISANFLDFPQNFKLRTQNQYCTKVIA